MMGIGKAFKICPASVRKMSGMCQASRCQYSYTTKFLFVTFCQKPLSWYLIPLLDQKILTAFNFECGQIFLSIIKSEILHNRMIVIFEYGTSNIFDHVENIFNLVKIFRYEGIFTLFIIFQCQIWGNAFCIVQKWG